MDLDDLAPDSASSVSDLILPRLPDPNAAKANAASRPAPLENLLMAKNRKLQDEVTALRVAHDELAQAHEQAAGECEALQARLDEQKKLNDRLENDLVRVNGGGGGAGTGVGGGGGVAGGSGQGAGQGGSAARDDPLAGLQLGKKVRSSPLSPRPTSSSADAFVLARSRPRAGPYRLHRSRARPRRPSCPSSRRSATASGSATASSRRCARPLSSLFPPCSG